MIILRSVTRDGATYSLDPGSLDALRQRFGEAVHARSRLFLSHETRSDYESVHASIVPQVIQLLTGLSEDRLRTSFGEIRFLDPATEQEIPLQ